MLFSLRQSCLSGDDSLTLPVISGGGKGVICTVANLVPQDMVAMIDAFNRGDLREAQRIHLALFPLIKALFVESNPIPLKVGNTFFEVIPADEHRIEIVVEP